MKTVISVAAVLAMAFATPSWAQQAKPVGGKPATAATKAANAAVLKELPFNDKSDFEDAHRGFIATPATLTIKNAKGEVVWDLEAYKTYISEDKAAPDSINPSLYRNAQLNMINGLFKVTDRIYQVRGFDLSNITFIQGDTGWIVFDPLISTETAKAALDFANEKLGKRPVVAVVYSHSHVDHYGGVRGLASDEDFKSGKVRVFAPEHFTEHAVSENVIAGNAMSRRAIYMYGALLPRNEFGGVNGGLGQTTSTGTGTLVIPTDEVKKTGEEYVVDGVKMVFQMTPGTEAPAEMNTFFPQFKAMWMAENSTNTMHNILTLRGAQVRDALKWASYLNETIDLYGAKTDVKFQSHHWPQWGTDKIIDYWKKQRDLYKYTHDQSVNLMNKGYTGEEISEMIKLPPELDKFWPNRGYYGSLRHNSRAVYQRYMGWYNGNPANLNNLPPEQSAKKYVEYMGGEAAVIKRAKADFAKGEYRWTAEALKHVVFANPNSKAGKELLADSLEQLGYQAESGPWRGVYLMGAYELRNGVPAAGGINTATPDTIKAMPPEMLFDYLAVRLNGPKAAGKKIGLNIDFTDLKKQYGLAVENAVLNYGKPLAQADAKLTLSKGTLDAIQLKEITLEQAVASGALKIDGKREAFAEFMGLLDTFPFWFHIVTP
ncbi:alkyl sulfatase dimerization domain-containing protein [Niveibacterium umoris]|uniref:Linear primary-alkylsulfatase n=1 Tax=Niveibacterium umoris TaxID=1193620 RepID=A0A840BI77_9RHOO|nr:alkyl sulfatase dimerization domain-containing protein [Niveibacterium umoris]MBB4011299.1 alkyl sulfatase BDS1-like metallo-beta-lactamase superfamily hydrolase [Niveibacterium umoris]